MSVSFNGFGDMLLTFKNAAEITAGYPVKMSANSTVAACSSGDEFCGFAVESDADYASVRVGGVVTAAYSGTAPTVGYACLEADGAGKVAVANSGSRSYLVLGVDTAAGTVTFIL